MFSGMEGYLCVVSIERRNNNDKKIVEHHYEFPDQLELILEYIDRHYIHRDLYFCVHLLDKQKRTKENALPSQFLWADVDTCPVEELLKKPSLLLQSSPGKTQAFWKLDEAYTPSKIEETNKRMAYYHAPHGMDKSGYDLTQLLRIPLTMNHKYSPPQPVTILAVDTNVKYKLDDFTDVYPELTSRGIGGDIPFPGEFPDMNGDDIIRMYQGQLNPRAIKLFEDEPTTDWSKSLWELEHCLLESGVPLDEAYLVVRDAACNKYARESRPETDLWAELVKAHHMVQEKHLPVPPSDRRNYAVSPIVKFSPILSDDERERVSKRTTLVEEYIEWAASVTDAALQYHQAGVFIVLSTLLAGKVTLPTSFATIRPNMWFMILGDTTLTRKSTAMDLAVDLLMEIDPYCLLATDGSIEGMLTALSTRPGRPSLFLRDEFTGLLEMINKRDYYAGMLEALTKLYDGRTQKKVLKKEEINIVNPILNVFGGGIKERTLDLLEERHVTSGFIPRFVFIMADTDLTRMKPIGPPTSSGLVKKKLLTKKFAKLFEYFKNYEMEVDTDKHTLKTPKIWEAELTQDAWRRYNKILTTMEVESSESEQENLLTPCVSRLAGTGLKVALIIAATQSLDKDEIVITEEDLLHAFFYVEQWREYTLQVIEGTSSSPQERYLMKIYEYIQKNPGCQRSKIMNRFKMGSRTGQEALATLEERGLLVKQKSGKTFIYTILGG